MLGNVAEIETCYNHRLVKNKRTLPVEDKILDSHDTIKHYLKRQTTRKQHQWLTLLAPQSRQKYYVRKFSKSVLSQLYRVENSTTRGQTV